MSLALSKGTCGRTFGMTNQLTSLETEAGG